MTKMKTVLSAVVLAALFSVTPSFAGDLRIELTDIRNDKGKILFSIFNDKDAFENVAEDKMYSFTFLPAQKGLQVLTLHDFPPGQYAVSILHDENENEKLDTNAPGVPQEGYAYSNNKGQMGPPSFENASFTHKKDSDTVQTIKMVQY